MSTEIVTENLGRHFGSIKAVDGVSFSVSRGEVLGFLGPNGAGKSTTMKMLTGFLSPSFGTASVAGFDVVRSPRDVKRSLGYLPENAPLYDEMSVDGFLEFIAEVRKIAPDKRRAAIDRASELTSIHEVARQRIETLSKGFKRRVGLAQALLHDPDILILDEPTDGLDPNQKHEVRQLIRSMAHDKCIILSTHILEEVDEVCNRVIIVSAGKIVADSSPDELRKQSGLYGLVDVRIGNTSAEALRSKFAAFPACEIVELADRDGQVHARLRPERPVPFVNEFARLAEKEQWAVVDLKINRGQLDEVFRSITTSEVNSTT